MSFSQGNDQGSLRSDPHVTVQLSSEIQKLHTHRSFRKATNRGTREKQRGSARVIAGTGIWTYSMRWQWCYTATFSLCSGTLPNVRHFDSSPLFLLLICGRTLISLLPEVARPVQLSRYAPGHGSALTKNLSKSSHTKGHATGTIARPEAAPARGF